MQKQKIKSIVSCNKYMQGAIILFFLSLPLGILKIGAFGSALKIIGFIPLFVWFLYSKKITTDKIIISFVCFILIQLSSMIFTLDAGKTLQIIETNLMLLLLMVSFSGFSYSQIQIDKIRKGLIWSSRITVLLLLLFGKLSYGRLSLSTGIINEDSNYINAYFIFGLIAAIEVLLKKNNVKHKIIATIEIGIYLYVCLSTGSRGGAFALSAASLIFYFTYSNSETKLITSKIQYKTIIKKIVIAIIFALTLFLVIKLLNNDVLLRFSATAIEESNGTGRYEIWESLLIKFQNSSFFHKVWGYGSGTIRYLNTGSGHYSGNVAHNIFVEILLENGLIGLLSYVIYIGTVTFCALRNSRYAFSIIVGMIVLSLSTSLYAFKPYWNIILYILITKLAIRKENSFPL